jgi:uncharacterized delta-60 repeat protein
MLQTMRGAELAGARRRRYTRALLTTAALVGLTCTTSSAQSPPWAALPDGAPDPRFGVGGIAPTIGTTGLVQPDGKILVGTPGALARHNVDGSFDETFGVHGIVEGPGGGSLVRQPDGRILALASGNRLVRYIHDGSLDESFGAAGIVTTPWPASSFGLGADGRIVVAGVTTDVVLARYNGDGSLDASFGIGGSALIDTRRTGSPSAVAIQADGKVVVAGTGTGPTSIRSDFLLARRNPDGTPDTGFGVGGILFPDFEGRIDRGTSLVIQPDGKIIVAGTVGANRNFTPFDFGLMRYNGNGTIDLTFGAGGRVRTIIRDPLSTSEINRVKLRGDGKIVVVGTAHYALSPPLGTEMAIVQYNSNGSVDPAFGNGGTIRTDFSGRPTSGYDLDIQPDGQVVAVGSAGTFSGCGCSPTSFLVRYRYDSARGAFGGAPLQVPGRIEAENYDLGGQGTGYYDTTPGNEQGFFVYRTDEVDIKVSDEGGHAIGWLAAGEWLAYTRDVPRDGPYRIEARVGSALPGRTFHVEVDGRDVTGPIAVPVMPDWDRYQTVGMARVPLLAGRRVFRVVMGPESFMELQWLAVSEAPAPSTGPFGGTPWPLPGRIEAEDYDLGGQGIGYSDTTPGNEQGVVVYRGDDVDVKASAEGGYAIGWLAAGEWLAYTTAVAREGVYRIEARVGSGLPGRTFHVEVDGRDVTGPIAVPQLPGWDQYETVGVDGVRLSAGPHVLRLVMGPEDFMDLQWIAVVEAPGSFTGPFGGTPWAIPGRIEAEDYDLGGQGIGYSDTTPGNAQGDAVYRPDDVDIKTSAEGGYAIGWLAAGEWLAYTTDVQADAVYTIEARVGSGLPGRTFHVEVHGTDVTGPIAVPQLPGWDQYETISIPGVRLRVGRQVLRVVMGPEDFMDFQWLEVRR